MRKILRTTVGIVALSAATVGAVSIYQGQVGAEGTRTTFHRGDVDLDRDSFSFTQLRTADGSALAGEARHAAMQECMADRGFELPKAGEKSTDPRVGDPGFEAAFGLAMIGDDGSSDTPPPIQEVTLPSGAVVAHVGTTVGPDSCTYEVTMQSTGLPYIERETLRVEMMMVKNQADAAVLASRQFNEVKARTCAAEADGHDLLAALDDAGDFCGTEGQRSQLRSIRNDLHHKVASENAKNVQAWIDVLERERAWAAQR